MTIRNLEHAFQCRSVALIGASSKPLSVGTTVLENLRAAGFEGPVWPVNPHHESLGGLICYPNVDALPEAPDLAVIATPARTVPQLIAELGARGTRAAVVLSAGLSEANGLKQAMLDAAKPHCLRVIGPNCFGLFVPPIGLNASFAHVAPEPGKLALLSQSGAIISAVLDWSANRHIGFSAVVSLGEMADVDVADLLDMLAGDRDTHAILMYLETVPHARKFMSAARAAARMKPVIVIKSGRHAAAAEAAATHTGALAGSDTTIDAAFTRAGLLRVLDLEHLFDAAETLTRFRPVKHGRVGIVTNGGGAGVLAVDRLMDFGGDLASLSQDTIDTLNGALPATWSHGNPVDIIGDAGPERYEAAVTQVLKDPGVDAVLVLGCPTALASAEEAAEAVIAAAEAQRDRPGPDKPVLASWLGNHTAEAARQKLRGAGIATYQTPADAVRSFGFLTAYGHAQEQLQRTPPALPADFSVDPDAARAAMAAAVEENRAILTEAEAKAVLSAFGIPTVETHVAPSAGEAGPLAARLLESHDAVAVKLLSRDISHKSDVGGVVLNLRSPEEAAAAAADIGRRVSQAQPEARIDGFTVQPMIVRKGAHELIAGIDSDDLFGPILLFGAGGTAVEVLADSAVALPPLDLRLAQDLIGETRVAKLLAGYRDRKSADLDAIALTLVRLSQMVIDLPQVVSLDINPLLADADGVIALDARIVIDPARNGLEAPNPDLAIRPYPSAWAKDMETQSGLKVLVRPILPSDELLYPDFLEKLEERDVRLRLLAPRKAFSHSFLGRLTQIDYAREMAFVAIDPENGSLLGVSRLAADPDYDRAEYAVIVRSDLKGMGLGWALMTRLMDYARAEGLQRLEGTVLAENTGMLAMCEQLGFSIRRDADNPGCKKVQVDLDQPAEPGA